MEPSEVEIQADSAGNGHPEGTATGLPERRLTQEVLRRSQEELRSVLASIPDYLWSADIDSQGRVTYRYYSPGVEKITGRPPEFYMLGPERWLSTVHPDDMPRIQKALKAIMTGNLPQFTEEYRIILPDGTIRWVRDNVQIRRQEGSTRVDGVVSDITERKVAEDALRLSEASFREALLAAQMGVWEWTAADGTLTWDENFYRIAGRDPNTPIPDDLEQAKMFAPESWATLKGVGANALKTGIPFELDLELIRPDGSKRWLIGRGKPRRDAHGRITHLRGTVQDITERKRAEEALRESEERYRRLFDQMLMGFALVEMIHDEKGHPCDYINLEVNPAFEIQTGFPLEKIRGKRIREVFPDIEPFWIETYGKVAATGESIHFEHFAEPLHKCFEVTAFRVGPGRVGVSFADVTERKRTEHALRRSEAVLKEALLAAQMGVWKWTPATDTVTWDENLYHLAGRDPKLPAPSYHEQSQMYAPESWERLDAAMERTLAGDIAFELDLELVRPDRSRRWVTARGEALRDADLHITQLRGTVQDITQRKRDEMALHEAETMLRFFVEHAPASIAMLDREMRYLVVSRRWMTDFNLGDRDIQGLCHYDVFPEIPEHWKEIHRRCLAGSVESCQEDPFPRLDGRIDWLRWEARPWRRIDDSIGGIIIFSELINERKCAEEALRESAAGLAVAQRIAHIGSWEWDVQTNEGYWSDETFRIFGMAPGRLEQHRQILLDLVHAEDEERVDQALAQAVNGTGQYNLDYRIQLPDGTRKVIHAQAEIVRNEAGRPLRMRGTVQDITQRRRAEEERQQSFDQLRALAAHLQSVREEERIRVAREIHDQLGQALTAIKIDLSSLIRELTAGEKAPLKRTSSILHLVDESIQVVRRISTELRPGILDDLGLAAALEWAGEDFQSRTGTTCRLHRSEEDVAVSPEQATAIFRIFQETLTNVARHAEAGAVDVRFAAEKSGLMLEVHDDGKGIAMDQLAAGKSLGILGMRERAMLLGGTLTIEGSPGNGTTVRVRMPGSHPVKAEQAYD